MLPFVGHALSSLFGTATETQLQDILSRNYRFKSHPRRHVKRYKQHCYSSKSDDLRCQYKTLNRLTNITSYLTDRLDLPRDVVMNRYVADNLESDTESVLTELTSTVKEF